MHISPNISQEIYLPNDIYDRLKNALAVLIEGAFQPFDAETSAIELLGEGANIWPRSILDDPDRA